VAWRYRCCFAALAADTALCQHFGKDWPGFAGKSSITSALKLTGPELRRSPKIPMLMSVA
jgi:hypothetical protein